MLSDDRLRQAYDARYRLCHVVSYCVVLCCIVLRRVVSCCDVLDLIHL